MSVCITECADKCFIMDIGRTIIARAADGRITLSIIMNKYSTALRGRNIKDDIHDSNSGWSIGADNPEIFLRLDTAMNVIEYKLCAHKLSTHLVSVNFQRQIHLRH